MRKLFLLFLVMVTSLMTGLVWASDSIAGGEITGNITQVKYCMYFLCVAVAAIFGTKAQSKTAIVALEGIARNPAASEKIFVPLILSLALIESLIIFTFSTIFVIK